MTGAQRRLLLDALHELETTAAAVHTGDPTRALCLLGRILLAIGEDLAARPPVDETTRPPAACPASASAPSAACNPGTSAGGAVI